MRKGRIIVLALVTAAALALASCGSDTPESSGDGGGAAKDVTLTIANTSGAQWTCGFNPFNPSVQGTTVGFVYETLMFVNTLKNAAETPMLATKYEWSSDKKQLTFTMRDGVKWNDGQPFSAKDVAFTFNLLKKYPGLDLNALWKQILTKVEAKDNTVVFSFKSAGTAVLLLHRRPGRDRPGARLVHR